MYTCKDSTEITLIPVWFNSEITIDNSSIFKKSWYVRGVKYIVDFIDESGNPRTTDTKSTAVKDSDCITEEDDNEKEEIGAGGDGDNIVQEENTTVRDPMEYCEHIQSEVKKAKQRVATKKIYPELTPEQMDEERRVQREQLQAIFKLMESQGGKFGIENIDDMQQQMKLYA
ncbi:hypothetical protein FSP39_018322 [Pinctada imbricata]|uniref:Matrix-remodeling-associated protein 7 helical domain-containing protein n=1 Tax=Pinctada imbricata TaxID=66713 RepID=A0AA89BQ56_PINIB|nr:hypothetical protein FSP39_018322 [Pinctada imbricata]